MLKRYWGRVTATGIVIAALGLLSYVVWAFGFFSTYKAVHQQERYEASRQEYEAPTKDMDRGCWRVPMLPDADCPNNNVSAEHPNKREYADLKAQQDMSEWALVVVLISIPGFFVSIAGLWALYWTFRQTREIAKAQERASLIIYAVKIGDPRPLFDDLRLEFGIRNVGETHANSVWIEGTVTVDPGAVEGKDIGPVETAKIVATGSIAIQPSKESVLSGFANISVNHWKLMPEKTNYHMTDKCRDAWIRIEGVVHYRDVFDDNREAPFYMSRNTINRTGDTWFSSAENDAAIARFNEEAKKHA